MSVNMYVCFIDFSMGSLTIVVKGFQSPKYLPFLSLKWNVGKHDELKKYFQRIKVLNFYNCLIESNLYDLWIS